MKLTKIGYDIIKVNETNYDYDKYQKIKRVHLIKFDFKHPTYQIIKNTLNLFPRTNRFVIDNNIKEYNSILRRTEKKYYVMNKTGFKIISFFRKNNKILLNFINLSKEEKDFFLIDDIFEDVLRNVEVIAIDKKIHDEKIEILDSWNGNCILINDRMKI